MWTYLDQHPWWVLVYLLVFAGTALSVADLAARRK